MNRLLSRLRLNLFFINDMKGIDVQEVIAKVSANTEFSLSYIALLIASTIVCTLGLLLNSPPIVIGGMLISPLMWPIMKTGIGITFERRSYVRQAISLLLVSVAISLISSALITILSPIKSVSNEILMRTNPTLLDSVIALAAGGIAAIAISEKKVSDSLAGVAIATSLMPPLCVSGIGLALAAPQISSGAFLLFAANMISILFIAVLVFSLVGITRATENGIRKKGTALIAVFLVLTAFPLFSLLKNYSIKTRAYQESQQILTNYLTEVSPGIYVENVSTTLIGPFSKQNLLIEADVLIPEDVVLDYQQKSALIARLESSLNRKIDLNLRVQKTISLKSEKDQYTDFIRTSLRRNLLSKLQEVSTALTVDSINIYPNELRNTWIIEVIVRADPSSTLTEAQRARIERDLTSRINQPVTLTIEIISRLKLKSQPDVENEQIRSVITEYMTGISTEIDIVALTLAETDLLGTDTTKPAEKKAHMIVTLDIRIPKDFTLEDQLFYDLKSYLSSRFERSFSFQVNSVEKTSQIFL